MREVGSPRRADRWATRWAAECACHGPQAKLLTTSMHCALSVLFALQDGPRTPRQPVQDPEELALLGLAQAVQQRAIALKGRCHQPSMDLSSARGERDVDPATLAPVFAQHQTPCYQPAHAARGLAFVETHKFRQGAERDRRMLS